MKEKERALVFTSMSPLCVATLLLSPWCFCNGASFSSPEQRYSAESLQVDSRAFSPHQLVRRNSTDNPMDENGEESFLDWLGGHWYVLLVILIVLVVLSIFVCACILKRRHTAHQNLELQRKNFSHKPGRGFPTHHGSDFNEHSVPRYTNSFMADFSPASLSIDCTPVPSPQPSFSSQRSARSSGRSSGKKRKRNPSSGHSSGSEETIKPGDACSVSSVPSSVSSMSHLPHLDRAQSLTGAERTALPPRSGYRGHQRVTSNPVVKVNVNGMKSDDGNGSLCSAPSTSSMLSVGSNQSARSSRSHSDASSQQTVVEVDVKVHLNPDQQQESVRVMTAAALAESARQLAQSAAEFGNDEEIFPSLPHRTHLPSRFQPSGSVHLGALPTHGYGNGRRRLFPSYSSSYLPSWEYSNGRPGSPRAVQTVSLDRPINQVSLDRPVHTFPIPGRGHSHRDSDISRSSLSPLVANSAEMHHGNVPSHEKKYMASSAGKSYPRPSLSHSHALDPRPARAEYESLGLQHSFGSDFPRHIPRPPVTGRPFHTLDSLHSRPQGESEFHSLKKPRSRTINGFSSAYSPPSVSLDGLGLGQTPEVEREEEERAVAELGNWTGTSSVLERPRRENGRVDHVAMGMAQKEVVMGTSNERGEVSREILEERDKRYLTLPHHYAGSEEMEGDASPHSSFNGPPHARHPPPAKLRKVRQRQSRTPSTTSNSELAREQEENGKEPLGLESPVPSTNSTIPRSPSSSTCLSSPTSSLNGDNQEENSTLKRQNSLPNMGQSQDDDNNHLQPQPSHQKALSLPRSNSELSLGEGPLSSIASGYAATGSGSSLERQSSAGVPQTSSNSNQPPSHSPQLPPNPPNPHGGQYSYPLQKLLAQPYYDPESMDLNLNHPIITTSLHMNHRHENDQSDFTIADCGQSKLHPSEYGNCLAMHEYTLSGNSMYDGTATGIAHLSPEFYQDHITMEFEV